MKFAFNEFAPDAADSGLIVQTGIFLKREVWGVNSPSAEELDFYRSYYLAVAHDTAGKLVAAGAMLGGSEDYYLADMATAPDYRRIYNLGSTILGMLEQRAKTDGAQYIRGWALSGAMPFYVRNGYQLTNPSDPDCGDIYKRLSEAH